MPAAKGLGWSAVQASIASELIPGAAQQNAGCGRRSSGLDTIVRTVATGPPASGSSGQAFAWVIPGCRSSGEPGIQTTSSFALPPAERLDDSKFSFAQHRNRNQDGAQRNSCRARGRASSRMSSPRTRRASAAARMSSQCAIHTAVLSSSEDRKDKRFLPRSGTAHSVPHSLQRRWNLWRVISRRGNATYAVLGFEWEPIR